MKSHYQAHTHKGFGPPHRGRRARYMAARSWMAENPTKE